ncbi:uncharacterized protein PgNI_02690 [Pyricularia grisea]|uniref:Nephrocystin 3-like N-terminal domain-containing protein n=1 Tax=Pyricularia grisea TaxID=148305 RepID=A0A6P8BF63_PYRGI|nr:uncharacterized protein PgNI_02690 [Pyricularia grisea]TLD14369.1 hypothetical protein PgNI_02690 [Pyricularia grisea]
MRITGATAFPILLLEMVPSSLINTPTNTASLISSPALSDGKFVCNQNQSWPTKACNNQGKKYHTPAFYQSSSQPCGDRELRSKFCQAAASSALELAPINSFSFSASATFFDEEHDNVDTVDSDKNIYLFGSIGTHNIVMASLPKGRIGTNPAASAIGDMARSFPNLRFVVMVGIAGGAPTAHNNIRLGDVIVGVPGNRQGGVRHCDFGVSKQNADFKEYGHLNGPPTKILGAIARLQTKHTRRGHDFEKRIAANLNENFRMKSKYSRPKADVLYEPDCEHPTGKNISLCSITCPPQSILERTERNEDDLIQVHYGVIASGNRKIEDALYRNKYAEEANIQCFKIKATGILNRFPYLIIRGICDYADTHINKNWQRFAAMAAATYTYDFLSSIPPKAIKAEKQLVEVINKLPKIEKINRDIAFTKLPTAKGATFDDHANEHDPACHPDTRVDLLDDINKRIQNPDGKHIFWLRGMAGTGKSTISRTVAKKVSETKMPIASFFFKKGEGDRGKAARFFTTIVDQLLPDLASHIHSAVESNPNIADKTMKKQFEKLFLKPLNKCNGANSQPLFVVVDALNERNRKKNVTTLIRLFPKAEKTKSYHLRFFVTSRPKMPIRLGFKNIADKYKNLALHEIPKSDIIKDIFTFLRFKLDRIRLNFNKTVPGSGLPPDWPPLASFKDFVDMAVPLFIFASTACRFIANSEFGNPWEQLNKIIEYKGKGQRSRLYATYLLILNQLFLKRTNLGLVKRTKKKQAEIIEWFRDIVGTIVLFANPLPSALLAYVLDRTKLDVNSKLRRLHFIFNISDNPLAPVKLLHLFFRDFLVDNENRDGNLFWIDAQKTHKQLAGRCFKLLSIGDNLKKDVCNLRRPGISRSEISEQIINTALPPDVKYACRYWVYYWNGSKLGIRNDDIVHRFLSKHLLYWLEILGIIGRIRESINMRVSGLAATGATGGLKVDTCLQTLEGHSKSVNLITFSADGHELASASHDGTVKLWDPATGACTATLKGYTKTLSFNATALYLQTDFGAILLTKHPGPTCHKVKGIGCSDSWITSNGQNFLYLPPKYRPSHLTTAGSVVALGSGSGRIIFCRICRMTLNGFFLK